ncbi:hypothetical protein DPEC_G00172660 [Dallia pectoralis]|uniref:Uncharacterized protein n=1 Tax=Dallia pectoralis TaxID=75939 RepID=A0ACC2GE18_DALPE|nr:hypothetical protein DPEC_G00172660 [Dallia pectoralis]
MSTVVDMSCCGGRGVAMGSVPHVCYIHLSALLLWIPPPPSVPVDKVTPPGLPVPTTDLPHAPEGWTSDNDRAQTVTTLEERDGRSPHLPQAVLCETGGM